jgi:hypothetical protein
MSLNPPASFPDNPWTQMIEETRRLNESGGMRSAGPVSAGPEPTVRSAAMGQPVVEMAPLSPEERAELDARARELGLMPAAEQEEGTKYNTLEEAIAAGQSVNTPPPPVSDPTERMTAREFLGRRDAQVPVRARVVETTRLPDFSKVQGIDLVRSVALVDGLEFALDPATVIDLRTLVLGVARDQILRQFDEALTGGSNGGVEEV